jgi:hypothetical protein
MAGHRRRRTRARARGRTESGRRRFHLNAIAVNKLLGRDGRVAMTMRDGHNPTAESNAQVYAFFEHFLKARA